jgi:chemotaxis protein MotB
MGQKRKQAEESMGAPLWMVTFSDCMNLLLTFFVLLVTFTSFDTKVLNKMETVFRQNFPTFMSQTNKEPKDAIIPTTLLVSVERYEKGSETPTLTNGPESNSKKETPHNELRNGKVFLIPSKSIFLGKGTVISPQGKNFFSTMALFLKEVSGRVVISEHGSDTTDNNLGFDRAWAAVDYLTKNLGLNKNKFSISAASIQPENSFNNSVNEKENETERTLEIVLLERSIYN